MKTPRWFSREFPNKPPLDSFPFVIERLRGGPARVEERTALVAGGLVIRRIDDAWSIQEHVGHLGDLEPLWFGRVDDLVAGRAELRPADLTNRKTHEAGHNDATLPQLLAVYRGERAKLVDRLDSMGITEAGLCAEHPRLKQPMRLIDLCHFVADHDDHHLALITEIMRTEDRSR